MIKRFSGVFALCMVLSAVGVQAFAQEGVKLQYKFVPNQLLRYKMTMNMTMNMQGGPSNGASIPMTMTGVYRQRVKQVLPNGDAEVAVAYESLSMDAMGNTIPTDVNKMPVISMVMSPAGAIKKVAGMDKMPGAMGNGGPFANMGSFVTSAALPLTPVKVGDKWAQDMAIPVLGSVKVQSQLASSDDKGATIKQSMSGNIDASGMMPSSGPKMAPKGTIAMDNTLLFSVADGRLLRSQGSGNATMSIGMPDGNSMNMVMKIDVLMEILGDK